MTKLNIRIMTSMTTVLFLAIVVVPLSWKNPKAAADTIPAQAPINAKSLFEEKCSACHDVPDPEEKGYTKAEWLSTVNRMLTTHGASNSISDVQAAQIVDYLGQFAPAPNQGAPKGIGIWLTDPVVSVSYPFTYAPNLANFDRDGGLWRVIETPDISSGYLKHVSDSRTPAILLENKNNLTGGLDLQVQFHINQSSESSAVGLVFGATDDKNYLSAVYSPTSGTISLSKIANGQASSLAQITAGNTTGPAGDGWHSIRVKVTEDGSKLEVLFDYQIVIESTVSGWQSGRVGLTSSGPVIAGFRQLSFDSYSSTAASPAGDVLLH